MTAVEVIEIQNEIIKLQSDSINELFRILAQHLTPDEIKTIPTLSAMSRAAKLNAQLNDGSLISST
jgi:hypothetical protein